MDTSKMRTRLLATSMITSAAIAASTSVYAQSSGSAAPSATTGQEIVVTGTRIPQPNLTSVSPITAITSQDIKLDGATDTIDALSQLPQVNLGNGLNNTPNPVSSSGGFTTVDLRNLGTVRTLVLEDGKRLMPGDPTLGGEAADLDTIPTALVDRVDVVTGGASAVYGSDAIAGVVNFIMKHNFQGAELDVQYGGDWHENGDTAMQGLEKAFGAHTPTGSVFDGATWNVSAAIGANSPDDKGNVTGFFTYRKEDPVTEGARDFSACQLSLTSGTPTCTGSSNSNFFNDQNTGLTYSVTGASPNNIFTTDRNQSTTPPAKFVSNTYEYLSRGDERYTGGFFAHYQAAPWADVYSDFSFMDDRSQVDLAPSALFQQTFNVNCSNPLLSAQQVQTICTNNGLGPNDNANLSIGRRDIEGGPRVYSYEHLSYKIDVGIKGQLNRVWSYDVYGQFGRTNYNYSVQNDISLSKVQNALLVGGTAANPVCQSGAPCVPYNIFADGGVTPAALNYILESGTTVGDTQEQIVDANATGKLGEWGIRSPWATDGVSVNIGTEYRREQLDQTPDETSLSGDLSGAGGALPPVHGAFDVKELFGEVQVPLLEDFPFVKEFVLDGGYRWSHYSLSGDTETYKVALDYAPTDDIRFRGSVQHAVRAPNINELFTPLQITNTSTVASDPCSAAGSGGAASATLAQCLNTAGPNVSKAQLQALYGDGRDPAIGGTDKISQCPSFQCGAVDGGNLKLTPETSDTYSLGVVITPKTWVQDLNFSVDYFNIDVKNAISTFPINIVLNDCLNSGAYCNLVVRQANGSIFGSNLLQGGYISNTNLNIGYIKSEGIDFSANYRFNLDKIGLGGAGHLNFKFDGTYTEHLIYEPIPGQGTYDCAGLYGYTCLNQTNPKWRHQLRVSWVSPWKFTLSGQWRFLSGTKFDANQTNLLLNGGSPAGDVLDGHIPDYSYFDLSGTWTIHPGVALRAGINNVFDKDPPVLDAGITGAGSSANTFNNYDLLGRTVFLGLTADF